MRGERDSKTELRGERAEQQARGALLVTAWEPQSRGGCTAATPEPSISPPPSTGLDTWPQGLPAAVPPRGPRGIQGKGLQAPMGAGLQRPVEESRTSQEFRKR